MPGRIALVLRSHTSGRFSERLCFCPHRRQRALHCGDLLAKAHQRLTMTAHQLRHRISHAWAGRTSRAAWSRRACFPSSPALAALPSRASFPACLFHRPRRTDDMRFHWLLLWGCRAGPPLL